MINAVGEVVNRDPQVNGYLRVVFLPDFNVKTGQWIYPAADLSEQISLAGKEASGTGNMKFSMNGALTIGTLDGANVEIRAEVGEENFFLFGLTAPEVQGVWDRGYRPREIYDRDPQLRTVIDALGSGIFSHGDRTLFRPLVDSLLEHDPYLALADFRSYVDCQEEVARCFVDQAHWDRMSILNVARIGRFSSDRAVREYCEGIWRVTPLRVDARPDAVPAEASSGTPVAARA
jgi:starch phosphorylase